LLCLGATVTVRSQKRGSRQNAGILPRGGACAFHPFGPDIA